MKKVSRSIKATTFLVSAIHANRQRITSSQNDEEIERQRLVRLNKMIEQAKKPVIAI
jgi:hypothetical protein